MFADGMRSWSRTVTESLIPKHGGYLDLKSLQNAAIETDRTYIEKSDAKTGTNCLICLINQTNYLLDQQLRHLDRCFLEEGGMTERLYRMRRERR
jgi:four helix bundle suffix protein